MNNRIALLSLTLSLFCPFLCRSQVGRLPTVTGTDFN